MTTPPARPELAVGAVVIRGTDLLLVQRATAPEQGRWSLPGGRVEVGETMADAVVREVREETGLDVECGPLVGWVERIADTHHFVIFDFLATPAGAAPLRPGDDAAAVRWSALDDLAGLDDLVGGLVDFLRHHGIVA